MPAALDGESESGFHRRRDWCGIEFSMLLFIPQNYRSNAAVRCKCRRRALHRPTQRAALPIAPPSVFRSIAERDSVEPLSENKAVQSVNRHKPSSARKEILSPPNTKPTAAMSISPNKTADCNAPTEASQSVIHSGALSSPRQPNSQFKILHSSLNQSPIPNSKFYILN